MKDGPTEGLGEEELFSYVSLACFARRIRDHVAEYFGHWIPRDEWDMLDDTVKQMAAEKVKEARGNMGSTVPEAGLWSPPAFDWKIHHPTEATPRFWWNKILPDGRMLGVRENDGEGTFSANIMPAGMMDSDSMTVEVGRKFRSSWSAKKAAELKARVPCSQLEKSGHRRCRKWGKVFAYDTRTWHCRQHWGRRTTDDEEVSQASRVSGS